MPLQGSAPAQGPESCPQGCHFKLKNTNKQKTKPKTENTRKSLGM